MADKSWVRAHPVVQQAEEQWHEADRWLALHSSEDGAVKTSVLIRFFAWPLAGLWRIAIALALVVSLLIEAITALLRPVFLFIDSLLGWLLLPLTAPLEAVLTIPYLGRAVGWIWRMVLAVAWGLLHVLEAPLVLLSVMPSRRLRLWVLPSASIDGEGALDLAKWMQAVELTSRILQREAHVQLVPVVPWESAGSLLSAEFSAGEYQWIRQIKGSLTGQQLSVACNLEALKEDLGPLGGQLDRMALVGHPRGSYRRVSGWGAPIMAASVTSVADGKLAGCSLGPLTDYVTVRADSPVCLAHEIGHACNLTHHENPDNLMNPTCGGVHLNRWQVLLLRLSRHTTYL